MHHDQFRPRHRAGIVTSIAAGLVLALVGCAGGAGPTSSPEPGALPDLHLNVGQISNSVAFFPIFVAEEEGFFGDEGLTLGEDRPRLGTGAKLAAAIQSGSVDVGGGVMTDAFNLYKLSNEARIIGSLVNQYYVDIVVGEDFQGADASDSLNDRIDALEGKTIGITGPGSGTEALIVYLLRKRGIDPAVDVTLVNLGADASAAIGALKSGQVDALSFFQPVGQQAEATGVGEIYISPTNGDVPALTDAMHGVLFTTQAVIDENGDAVAAFLRGIARAEELIANDPEKTAELLEKYLEGLDPDTIEALIPILAIEVPESPAPNEDGYNKSADFHVETRLVDETPDYEDIVPESFVESALAG